MKIFPGSNRTNAVMNKAKSNEAVPHKKKWQPVTLNLPVLNR
jgi:hypothetical protein